MKVLLLFPYTPTFYGLPNYPPLGLSYLAGMLRNEGIEYNVLDLRVYKDWNSVFLEELKKEYDLVGMGCTAYDYNPVRHLAQLVKTHSKAKVFVGGAYPTLVKDKILRDDGNFDFVIFGEGEFALKELVEAVEGKRSLALVRGLVFRKGNKIIVNPARELVENLDEIPFPDYEKYDLRLYHGDTSLKGIIKRRRIFPMSTSRGCPYNCIFCSVPVFSGKKFRARSPKNIIEEMKQLKRKYNAGVIDILDDNMTFALDRAKEICRLIIEERLSISWGTPNGIRADRIDDELACLMKKSGCIGVAVGIESVDNEVLKRIKKAGSIEKITDGIKLLKKYKIPVKGFFLVGSPGGSKEEVLKALDYAKKMELDEARFSMVTPYPGTEIYEWVSANKLWCVSDPEKSIVKFTHGGDVKALFETREFSARDAEEAYSHVTKEWDKYELSKSFSRRMKLKLLNYPRLRNFLKNIRDGVKK